MNEHLNTITVEGIASLLKEKEEFLLLCHTNPDEDTAGSAYALYLALKKMGKKVAIACEAKPHERATGYVDPSVFVTPDLAGAFDTEPYQNATVISIDVASRNMLGLLIGLFADRVDVKIDHHAIGEDFGKLNYTDSEAGACGMILYEILDKLDVWDKEMASALYLAISSDTGGFHYSNTDAKAHRVAAALLELGADGAGVSESLFETKSQRDFRALQLGLSKMRYLCDGTVALISISNADKDGASLDDSDLGELPSVSRQPRGVVLGMVLKQTDGDAKRFKLSVRSRAGFDAAVLCQKFGGGGHSRAAGATIHADSMQKAEKAVLDAVYPMIGDMT